MIIIFAMPGLWKLGYQLVIMDRNGKHLLVTVVAS